ncbi:MAG: hypothetical protein IT381_15480 [Deltaproteobacteria bacterium]|nr:hypothetical protein [Deltaproteobacteria bacterium]
MTPALAFALFLAADPAPAAPPPPPAPSDKAMKAPASQPSVAADLKVRVVYGHSKTTVLDAKLNDLFGSLKNLTYTAYELKSETSLNVTVGGAPQSYTAPQGRHLVISATAHKKKGKVDQVNVQLEIPELKFKTKAWISAGATLVIGGPKFEDGVLLFAVGAAAIRN